MADIAELENRIEDLEELTTLSLLENATETLTVIDSAGNERTKAGFLADNFKGYAFSADNRLEYRAHIDINNGIMQPLAVPNNIRLLYDSASSTTTRGPNAGATGDLITLPIDSNYVMIDQSLATETENINPFAVITGLGHMDLSPASDEWVERRRVPEIVIDGGTITRVRRVVLAFGGGGAARSGEDGSSGGDIDNFTDRGD